MTVSSSSLYRHLAEGNLHTTPPPGSFCMTLCEKITGKYIKKTDPMIFLSTFYLIGLYISALHRRNPCQKCEAFPGECKDENMLNKLLCLIS